MNTGRVFYLRLFEAIMAVVIHMMHAVSYGLEWKNNSWSNFGDVLQTTLYGCWIVILGVRLDAEMFELEGFDFAPELFATIGGGSVYALAAVSTLINCKGVGFLAVLVVKSVFALILSITLFVETILLCVDV